MSITVNVWKAHTHLHKVRSGAEAEVEANVPTVALLSKKTTKEMNQNSPAVLGNCFTKKQTLDN